MPSCRQKPPANHAAVPPAKKLKTSGGGAKASGKENTAGKNQSGGRQVSLKAAAVCCAGKSCVKMRSVSGVPQQQYSLEFIRAHCCRSRWRGLLVISAVVCCRLLLHRGP